MGKVLSTHVGSLPRPQDVVDMIFARERNEDYDLAAFGTTTKAVSETVRKQAKARVDFIEHSDLVAKGIVRFANIVGTDRVSAGSDCGFGTIDPDVAYAKLAALADGAKRAS